MWTAELNPQYVGSIERNYAKLAGRTGTFDQIPEGTTPVDLANPSGAQTASDIYKRWGKIDLLLAGPPCQGFSLSNRRSRVHTNPLNTLSLLILDYAKILRPKIIILENVPGIRTLKSSPEDSETTIFLLQRELRAMGYGSRVMVLDAANFGVPQFRLRSFLIAALGSDKEILPTNLVPKPTHGPKTELPHVTVKEAIGDLPPISNGCHSPAGPYLAPPQSNFQSLMRHFSTQDPSDHVTSKHGQQALGRFALVPQGGNWKSVRETMTNYKNPDHTHCNIYYRLHENQPSKTIGNFRKSMLIHPKEARGLSLREAARLQSIPDWVGFADPTLPAARGVVPGLNLYQQQIGNAVSYLLTEALVSHVVNTLGH